ncbi:uncharacterized protein LOC143022617 [Oratosquilla oratoria]|uniref:uncharacterized protein LOC143022617 n=1 Tax=Oratosquilla oratoria TaxID=337810 RepID=UPI003F7647D0
MQLNNFSHTALVSENQHQEPAETIWEAHDSAFYRIPLRPSGPETPQRAVMAMTPDLNNEELAAKVRRRHIEAANQLRADPNITIRRADKTAAYVLIETDEYLQKLDQILGDTSKFKKITKDPTESLKKKLNQLNDNIPTPSYHIAKKLGEILTPYVPTSYSVKSPTDFLDLLANTSSKGTIALLDVENLFTNISVYRTIQYIIKRVYHDNDTPNCDIPEHVMKKLLECCTKEAPFTCPRGTKYCQIDGVAMGSPLGVLFANFFHGEH